MPSAQAEETIAMYAQYRLAPDAPSRTVEDLRAMTAQALAMQPEITDAAIDDVELGGVRAERTVANGTTPEHVVVYFHGGGYICGSVSGQRVFLTALSRAADAEVLSVDYRLAPEHRHPAAVDDGVAAYAAVLARGDGRPVSVGGDSAGGGLALAVVIAARDRGLSVPAAAFALSPWADLDLTSATLQSHATRDIMVRRVDLELMRESYLGGVGEPRLGTVSPAHADLRGLPPLLLQAGGEEVLVGDAELLAERARAAGVEATLEVADGMFHTWQVLAPHLPESQDAIASLASFLREATTRAR